MILRIILVISLLVFSFPLVEASHGFLERFNYTFEKDITSITPFDIERNGKLSGLAVSTKEGKVYFFNSAGKIEGTYTFQVPVYAIAAFSHDENKKLDDIAVGALDSKVYALWKPWSDFQVPPASYWWDFDTGGHVIFLESLDFGEYSDGYEYARNRNFIAVGTIDFLKKSSEFMVLNSSGYLNWSVSLSSPVNDVTAFDLQSHKNTDYIAIAYGSTLEVYTKDGGSVWSYTFTNETSCVSPADLDEDEAIDDLIVGAGKEIYAFEHNGELLWNLTINETISCISPIDRENDGTIDYYLVGGNETFFAIDKDANILWKFWIGRKIGKCIFLDLDENGVSSEIALTHENRLFAYNFSTVYLPEIKIEKELNESELRLTIQNVGDGDAGNVEWKLDCPAELDVNGTTTWRGDLSVGESKSFMYNFSAKSYGNFTIIGTLNYSDIYNKSYIKKIAINLTFSKPEVNETISENKTESISPPKLQAQRILSKDKVMVGENVSVDILLQNFGGSTALAVSFNDEVPKGFIVSGNTSWSGNLEPGESRVISYVLVPKNFTKSENITLKEITIIYRSTNGSVYQETIKPAELSVIVPEKGLPLDKILTALIAAMLLFILLIKKKRIKFPKPKIKEFRFSRKIKLKKLNIKIPKKVKKVEKFESEATVDEELEKKFLKLYLDYQTRGERPTYGDVMKALGLNLREVETLVKNVKEKIKS